MIITLALALLTPSFFSTYAQGAIVDKTVLGGVYDQASNPLRGAEVTVEIWGGYWPEQDFFRTSESTTTDAWGYYEVTFNSNYWDPHNTIKVIVTYGLEQESHSVEANGDQYQTVDIYLSLTIPEFSGGLSLMMMVCCVVLIIVLQARRRRHRL